MPSQMCTYLTYTTWIERGCWMPNVAPWRGDWVKWVWGGGKPGPYDKW